MAMKHFNAFYLSIRECLLFFIMYISKEFVAKQMYLLIHLMNSVLAYFHSRLHSDLFFVLHPYFTRFQISLFQKTIFPSS